jgi:acetoin utilization protein AcuB
MLVKDIMTVDVITISEDKTMLEAQELMKGHNIRRVPVVDDIKRVLGIITDGDVGRASPSEASTLSRYEANYLLSRFKVKDVMTKEVITVRANSGLEDVAGLMFKNKINSLPVVDDKGCLCGIVTDSDLFRAMVQIFGLDRNCTRITIDCTDKVGVLANIGKMFADRGINIISVTTRREADGSHTEVTVAADLSASGMDVIEDIREAGYNVTDISTVKVNK